MLCYLLVSSARSALFLFKLEACLALLCRAVRFGRCLACARLATQEKKLSPFVGVCVRVSVCVWEPKRRRGRFLERTGGEASCVARVWAKSPPALRSFPPSLLQCCQPFSHPACSALSTYGGLAPPRQKKNTGRNTIKSHPSPDLTLTPIVILAFLDRQAEHDNIRTACRIAACQYFRRPRTLAKEALAPRPPSLSPPFFWTSHPAAESSSRNPWPLGRTGSADRPCSSGVGFLLCPAGERHPHPTYLCTHKHTHG